MPLTTLVKTLVENKVGEFCKRRIPPHVLDEMNLSYNIRGSSVTIFENRAPWRPEIKEWSSRPIAQIRFDGKTGKWTLYCADRNNRWHKYEGLLPIKNIEQILVEIDRDPTGIFWG